MLDQLDKDINTFSMRIKEWYSYHFPELVKIVPDNEEFAKVVSLVKRRSSLKSDRCVIYLSRADMGCRPPVASPTAY